MSGKLGDERQPVAITQNRALWVCPSSVATVQCEGVARVAAWNEAAVTRVLNRMWRRRSNRAATWRM